MILSLIPILYLFCQIPTTTATCQSFTPQPFNASTNTNAFTTTDRSCIVSPIVNCSNLPNQTPPGQLLGNETMRCRSDQCHVSVPADYYLRVNRTLSISVGPDQEQAIFDLVRPEFGNELSTTDLDRTGIWPVTQVSTCVNESIAAWWIYTAIYSCVEGNLTGCDAGRRDPAEGTFIRACGIRVLPNGNRLAGGVLSVATGNGVNSTPAPANATENGSGVVSGAGRGIDGGFEMAFFVVVGLVMWLNLGM